MQKWYQMVTGEIIACLQDQKKFLLMYTKEPLKNQFIEYLNALSQIKITNKKIKLLIVGECYEKKRKYLKLIDELKLTKKIIWIDEYIPNSKINLYFSACDLVALPYKKASQSGIIPIAYNYNKLVVASDIEGLNEYVINNETGYLFKNKNFNSLASILKNIYFNHDFEISDNNIRKYKKEFSTKKLIQEIISFI